MDETPPINNYFLQKYESALFSVNNVIREKKPDIIIALSRKGPRLIELFDLIEIKDLEIPVITEKAIDFLPLDFLKEKKILILDDIIISGTTLRELLSLLSDKFNADLSLLSVAIDEDTIAFNKEADDNYRICLRNGEKIVPYYKIPLSKEDRFVFCHEIIRSFIFLNKPYDIDYPIFYLPDYFFELLRSISSRSPFRAFNLTTNYQNINDFKRYSFLPSDFEEDYKFFSGILNTNYFTPEINKVRAYFDIKREKTIIAPIVTFTINSLFLNKTKIFSKNFSQYNDFISSAKLLMAPENVLKATYRLVWFFVCYLYGLSFLSRIIKKEKFSELPFPSKFLNKKDIDFIFGPLVSDGLISLFDDTHSQTKSVIEKFFPKKLNLPFSNIKFPVPEKKPGSVFDNERKLLYNDIKNEILKSTIKEDVLTNHIASIFEALYYKKEATTQQSVRECGISGDEYKRLKVGFNHSQIKEILSDLNILQNDHDVSDLKISLAYDFLVDAGIQIPIFYYDRADGYYERAYRWGEDALSAKTYAFLISEIVRNLFDYIDKNDFDLRTIPRISFEKKGVIFYKEIYNQGLVDALAEHSDGDDRKITLIPHYSRHGKILHISDASFEDSNEMMLFSDWCEKQKIVKSINGGGLIYSNGFIENLKLPNGYIPRLVPEETVASFISLSILLYHIDCKINKRERSEILTALTTCADYESYFWALIEELRLFFKSSAYKFRNPLMSCLNLIAGTYDINNLLKIHSLLSQKAHVAVHEFNHKINLWNDFNTIISEIEYYFKSVKIELSLLYNQNLKKIIDEIKITKNSPVESLILDHKIELEIFGSICYGMSRVCKTALELIIRIQKKRITKSGSLYKTDFRVFEDTLIKLHTAISELVDIIRKHSPINNYDIRVIQLDKISDDLKQNKNLFDKNLFLPIFEEIIAELSYIYNVLEKVYNNRYSVNIWEKKMEEMFPKQNIDLVGIIRAIDAASDCKSEDGKIHPKVGAVIIKDNKIVCTAYRGMINSGEHAEFTAIRRKSNGSDLKGATLITTLEPCTSRKHDKKPCAQHIVDSGINRVIIGMIDPNPDIRGKGVLYLQRKNVIVDFFPSKYEEKIRKINKEFWESEWKKYKLDLMKEEPSLKEDNIEINKLTKYFYDSNKRSLSFHRIRIFEVLNKKFNKDDVKNLSKIYLDIDPEELDANTKSGLIRELIDYCEKKKSIEELLNVINQTNPALYNEIMQHSD